MELVTKNYLKADDFKGKVVVWDLDGVLAPYRFNGHIMHKDIGRNCTDEEVEAGVFRERIPCKHIHNITESIDAKKQVCITMYIPEEEATDKVAWVGEHFHKIEDIILNCMEDTRSVILEKYCRDKGIAKEEVIVIDDDIRNLTDIEAGGFECWHVSSLMDFYENK